MARILLVAATEREIGRLRESIEGGAAVAMGHHVDILVTGVGCVATAYALTRWMLTHEKPDVAINIGIAGMFNSAPLLNAGVKIGDVVLLVSDCFADMGAESSSGFHNLFEMGLIDADEPPFQDGALITDGECVEELSALLMPVVAITVSCSTGSRERQDMLMSKYKSDIETMEGAAFSYICINERVPRHFAIRSISNVVGYRDIRQWNIDLALSNLSEKVLEVIRKIQ